MTTAADTISTPLLIAGEERPGSAGAFPVYDPAHSGAIIGYAAAASADDALAAVAAAEAAWPAWAAMSATERVGIVLKALEGLEADNDARTDILSRENGKIRFEAFIDLAVFSGRFHQAAQYAPELDVEEHIAGPPFNTTITKLSRGVVTIIYPFNWPLAILAASLPAALMSGNTVIVKPPPTTPLSSVQTLRHLVRALPPGVLNVVTGADEVVGPVVVGDPRIRHVCFTGSVGGGKRIMTMAAANVTNVTLELGGNDPALVLDDAVLDEAAFAKMSGATFMTTGQVCMALKRLYVPRSRYDEVIDGLKRHAGRPEDRPRPRPGRSRWARSTRPASGTTSPSCSRRRRRPAPRCRRYGEYAGDWTSGNYMLPSLVLDPAPELGIVAEEQFGPALPVIPYDDEEQAIRLANATWSGLCSSVWSGDTEHAMRVARQLRTGVTFFNNHNATAVDERAPFGGFAQSGIGRELGREGMRDFTETHVMAVPVPSEGGH